MTQLDLPQISLQRYLDLLRRRRWQVIPVSLLGLLIGMRHALEADHLAAVASLATRGRSLRGGG